ARRGGRDLHAEVLHQLLELRGLRDEVGLAVDLDQDADLAAGMDVGADGALGRRAGRPLRGLREPALAEEPDGLLEVALGLAERLLTVEEPGPGLLPQLLDAVEAHLARFRLPPLVDAAPAGVEPVTGRLGRLARTALALLVEVAALDDGLG